MTQLPAGLPSAGALDGESGIGVHLNVLPLPLDLPFPGEPTADHRVLPGGTAYITDVGMTGARGGVIGVRKEQSISVMKSHMPIRYDAAEDDPWLMGALIRCATEPRRAASIEPVLRAAS